MKEEYWKFTISQPNEYALNRWGSFENQVLKHHPTGKELGRIHSNTLVVWAGYRTDCCSPKFKLGDFEFGTPDGRVLPSTGYPITLRAALIHDILYATTNDIPRKQVDIIFRDILLEDGFDLAYPYYWAVRLFGGFWTLAVDLWRGLK